MNQAYVDDIEEFRLVVGNTSTPLGGQLLQKGDDGTYEPADVSAHTIKFTMVDEDGDVVVDEAAATIENITLAKVQYEFLAADVDEAGMFYGWFTSYDADGETATFPTGGRKLRIRIDAKA